MRTSLFTSLTIFGLILLFSLNSCEDEPDIIGLDLVPGRETLKVSFDSLNMVRGYTHVGDSVLSNYKVDYILGSQVDPWFGSSKAEIVTQIQSSTSSGSFGDNPEIDSAVLNLNIKEIIGESAASLGVYLYEYTELIEEDTAYFSNMNITGKFNDQILGTGTMSSTDTVIRIAINNADFFSKFLEAEDSVLSSTDLLQEYVRGLYITTDDATDRGIFAILDWQEAYHELNFYYSNDSSESLTQDYIIAFSSIGINLFQHDYTGYPIETYISNGSLNDSIMFLQSLGGASPKIKLEGLSTWTDSMPVAIMNATLSIPVVDTNITMQSALYRPSSLRLFMVDSNRYRSNYDYILDPESSSGDYDDQTNSYIFDLKVHIQSIVKGDLENLEMILKVSNGNESVNRSVLHGWSQDPKKRIKLEITYAKL